MKAGTTVERPYFFVHIAKTAGTSLIRQIRANVPDEARYPHRSQDPYIIKSKLTAARLAEQPDERLRSVRAFHPHLPYCAIDLLPVEPLVLTILREPVQRVVSHLKRLAIHPAWPSDPEAIYRQESISDWWLVDHQVRVFSLAPDELDAWDANAEDLMRFWKKSLPRIPMDADRLAVAKSNLDRIDIVGVTDRYDELLTTLETTWGWTCKREEPRNVSRSPPRAWRSSKQVGPGATEPTRTTDDVEIPDSLRERIAEDNQLDHALYEHASAIVARRMGGRPVLAAD